MSRRVKRFSGIQKQVLGLYRSMLQAVNRKPEDGQQVWRDHIRAEFDKSMGLSRGDVSTIEHRLRIGFRQLKLVQQDNVPYLSIKKVRRDDDSSGSRESTSS